MHRKIIAIFLGFLILNAGTELHQLFKLPQLVKHYLEHRFANNSISFLDFLQIHYITPDHPDDNDDQEDNELPFKSSGPVSHLDAPVIFNRVLVHFKFYYGEKMFTSHPEGIPKQRSYSVFHPPRSFSYPC